MSDNLEHLRILDTTLRDGEQSPGVALSADPLDGEMLLLVAILDEVGTP